MLVRYVVKGVGAGNQRRIVKTLWVLFVPVFSVVVWVSR
jgi:hypothetical protein